jgi:ABC-type lipoprotein release transport system permease subunit
MFRLTQGSGQPGNVVVLSEGATDELFSNLVFRDSGDIERHPLVLRDEEGRSLASWELYLVVNQVIPHKSGTARKRRFLQVRGLDDPARSGRVHGLDLYPGGSWFSAAGVQPRPGENKGEQVIQAVLGEGIARELGDDQGKPSLQVGDLFEVGPRRWLVVGLLRSNGSTFDSEVWAKRQIAGPMFGKESIYTTLVLRTAKTADARTMAEDLSANYKKAPVKAQVETDYYDQLNATNQQFLFAIIFVAIFMAVGGVFAVMNTMFAAISQRIKDIGILRILGFARWQVLVSFFLESLLIALAGGLLGCGLGLLSNLVTMSSMVGSGHGGGKSVVVQLVADGNILASGLLFALTMGSIGGLVPSLWAMRLKALESLR